MNKGEYKSLCILHNVIWDSLLQKTLSFARLNVLVPRIAIHNVPQHERHCVADNVHDVGRYWVYKKLFLLLLILPTSTAHYYTTTCYLLSPIYFTTTQLYRQTIHGWVEKIFGWAALDLRLASWQRVKAFCSQVYAPTIPSNTADSGNGYTFHSSLPLRWRLCSSQVSAYDSMTRSKTPTDLQDAGERENRISRARVKVERSNEM
jgi:hypothetical protein